MREELKREYMRALAAGTVQPVLTNQRTSGTVCSKATPALIAKNSFNENTCENNAVSTQTKRQLGAVGVGRQPEGRMGTASGQHVAHSGALQKKLGQLVDNLVFPLKNAITLQACNAPLIAHPLSMLRCSHCHTDLCHGQCGRRRERERERSSASEHNRKEHINCARKKRASLAAAK